MITYSKLNLLLGCFNQNVFSDAKMNISLLKLYYSQDAFSKNNSLINKLLTIIENYKFIDITESLFRSAFTADGKSDEESSELINKIKTYKQYSKEQSKVFCDDLKKVCYQAYITRAKNKYPEDSVGYIEELKKFVYKTNVSNNLVVKNYNELDITDLAQRYSGEGYKSAFNFINRSYTCGGYIPGQIVAICAPPGCFHGDTEVMTLDGKTKKMNELVEIKDEDYRYVYSIDGNMNPVVSKSSGCRITGYVDKWVELDIDGTKIKCTENHEFMLVDGTYKCAIDLKPGDSLRSICRNHRSRFNNGRYSIGDYEYCTTEGVDPKNAPYTHNLVKSYLTITNEFVPEEGIKYQVHHAHLVNGKFDRSYNMPSELKILPEKDHLSIHSKYAWSINYEEEYKNLIKAGKNTRITSEVITNRNIENWKSEDYRARMRKVTSESGKKVTSIRNIPQSDYNGASLQRVMSVKKYIKYLIDEGIINCKDNLTEKVYNENRYGPRVPSWCSAMRYFSNDIDRLYSESLNYQNHTVRSVAVINLKTPEPCYDVTDVAFYENYCIACGGLGSGVVVHNCGKSLFVQNEVVNFMNQGKRVHMLTLGDLNEMDLAIRLTCMMAKKPKRVIESDIMSYYSLYKSKFSNLLGMTVVPSGLVTGREYVDWMLQMIDDYDVLIIDYDSNFKKASGSSMYDEYGELYDAFTELTRAGKLVFVCTQPKIGYWKHEEIPLEGLGESSRKQHIIDMAITIGRRHDSRMRMGKMSIVKSRRGDLGVQDWIGTSEGLFFECSKLLYAKYKNQDTYIGLFTYNELEQMDILGEVFAED